MHEHKAGATAHGPDCENDLQLAARRLGSCSSRVEHLQTLVEFLQSDNEQLRSLLRIKDALRQPNAQSAKPRSPDRPNDRV